MATEQNDLQKAIRIFTVIVVLTAVGAGLSSTIFSNYFKEVYNVDSVQRGFIEFPRELPGVLCMVIVSALSMFTDISLSILAQVLCCAGLVVLGLFSPSYGVMLFFLFVFSFGQHLFMPLNDSISMNLAKEGNTGKTLGHFKSRSTMFTMLTACAVFFGFKFNFFSFTKGPVILSFVLAAVCFFAAGVLLVHIRKFMPYQAPRPKHRLIVRKQYIPYYIVTFSYGCQKRVKLVFGPWVIIELLKMGADTTALLSIVTAFIGMFAAPQIGKILDKFGAKTALIVESVYIALTFVCLGLIAGGLSAGSLSVTTFVLYLTFVVYVLSCVMDQFNMVHAFLMKSLAVDPSEITESLSVGLSVDHVIAVVASAVLGIVWSDWGPQYVFYLTAAASLFQIGVAFWLGANSRTTAVK